MKKLSGILSLLFLSAVLCVAQSPSPNPSVSYGGPGTPAMGCAQTSTLNQTVLTYVQTDATAGRALWYAQQNSDGSCSWIQRPSPGQIGTYIQSLNNGGALTAQTVCDTSLTCPAGFYSLNVYLNVTTTGSLGSITAINLAYTDETGATTMNLASIASNTCPAISLLVASRCSVTVNFYKMANTAVTLSTAVGTLGGSPKYNVRASLMELQ